MNGSVWIGDEFVQQRATTQRVDTPIRIPSCSMRVRARRWKAKWNQVNQINIHTGKFIHIIENTCSHTHIHTGERIREHTSVRARCMRHVCVCVRLDAATWRCDKRKNANILDLRVQLPLFSSLYVDFRASSHKYIHFINIRCIYCDLALGRFVALLPSLARFPHSISIFFFLFSIYRCFAEHGARDSSHTHAHTLASTKRRYSTPSDWCVLLCAWQTNASYWIKRSKCNNIYWIFYQDLNVIIMCVCVCRAPIRYSRCQCSHHFSRR